MTIVVGYIPSKEGSAAVDAAIREAQLRSMRLVVVNTGKAGDNSGPHFATSQDLDALAAAALGPLGATSPEPVTLTAVASGMGPGPFTGLRVGIAAARAFALGRGIPVIPVASHDAAALAILLADPFADLPRFAVVTAARRRERLPRR